MSKFKIGDRVRENKQGKGVDLIQHWNTYWSYKEGLLENDFFIVVGVESGDIITYSNRLGGNGPIVTADYLELVEEEIPMPTPEYSCIRVVPPSKPKREIVDGAVSLHEYARVKVSKENCAENEVNLLIQECPFFTATALREAAALFTTLAEVLEENAK